MYAHLLKPAEYFVMKNITWCMISNNQQQSIQSLKIVNKSQLVFILYYSFIPIVLVKKIILIIYF